MGPSHARTSAIVLPAPDFLACGIARSAPRELRLSGENSSFEVKENVRLFGTMVVRSSVIAALCLAPTLAVGAKSVSRSQTGHLPGKSKSARPAPKASIPYTSFNFGDVYTGDVISQIFVLKNEGNADLLVGGFKADCGCTVARSDSIIPPGQEGTAEVEVQTISQSGSISKSAMLQTNDPSQPTIVFTITANVLKGSPIRQGKYIGPLFVSPDTLVPMYAPAGRKSRAEFTITAPGAAVNVVGVESGTKQFVSRVEVIQPGRNYKIVVESVESETGGLFRDQLRVTTDNPTLPAFKVALALRVYPRE